MNLKEYLNNKKNITERVFREKCYKCFRPKKNCFCTSLKHIETNSEFVILMHPMEAKKVKIGTARLANVCLNNCRIIQGVNFTEDNEVNSIINSEQYYSMVLYPGESSHNITLAPIEKKIISNKKLLFFIIDGTWANAKIIMRESKNIQKLSRISFSTSNLSKFSIKHQPDKFCLSTIESIYYLLDSLNKWDIESLNSSHDELNHALKMLVDFQVKCAEDPTIESYRRSGGFKKSGERKASKKWKTRSICYDEKNYK